MQPASVVRTERVGTAHRGVMAADSLWWSQQPSPKRANSTDPISTAHVARTPGQGDGSLAIVGVDAQLQELIIVAFDYFITLIAALHLAYELMVCVVVFYVCILWQSIRAGSIPIQNKSIDLHASGGSQPHRHYLLSSFTRIKKGKMGCWCSELGMHQLSSRSTACISW